MEALASLSISPLYLTGHEATRKPTHGSYISLVFPKQCFRQAKLVKRRKKTLGEVSPQATGAQLVDLTKEGLESWSDTAVDENKRINELVREIRENFRAMNDGETSPSAYDTAWVARIPSADNPQKPHFPETLDWILKNQHEDGSWGEPSFFLLYDRLVCTLACALALKTWSRGDDQLAKALNFLQVQTRNLDKESNRLRTCGFEIAFPSMLIEAKSLGLDLPYELPCLQEFCILREKKLRRIPVEVIHSVHTTMLYNLEVLQELVLWEKILKLQSADGSFLSSPAATAVVYMKTGDKKCLEFLTFVVRRFRDNAPCQYPIDLLERLWAVDTIQRLGIGHHFRKEIDEVLDYVYRHAGIKGVSWGRDNPVPDVDDTCMALRLMRLHGYPVSPDVLEYFKDDDGNILCFPGETHRGVSDMFNLYRLSQVAFPGEKILKEAKLFTEQYLRTCLENNQLEDKWSLKKALNEEVDHALKYPWNTSLQRLEAREYIDQYGENDVWIAKTIYWMYNVNNPLYLELAKLDFNRLQPMYHEETMSIQKWWNSCGLADHFTIQVQHQEIHSLIAATLYEPEFSASRIAYTKCNFLEDIIKDLFHSHESVNDLRLLCEAVEQCNPSLVDNLPIELKAAFKGMCDTYNELALQGSKAQGRDISPYLQSLRVKQLQTYLKNREIRKQKNLESSSEYIEVGKRDAGITVRVVPPMFLLRENLKDHLLCHLDDRSRFHDQLSLLLTLINFKNFESKNEEATLAINCVMKEKNCSKKEVEGYISDMIEGVYDDMVHEYLKPSRVPRNSRRLMFEHSKIMQHLLSADQDITKRREIITKVKECLSTPI